MIATVPGTSIRAILERACRERGHSLRVTHSVTQHQTIVAMVAAGLGVALLPALSMSEGDDVARVNVVNPQITRDIGIIQRKGGSSSAAVQEFMSALKTAVKH